MQHTINITRCTVNTTMTPPYTQPEAQTHTAITASTLPLKRGSLCRAASTRAHFGTSFSCPCRQTAGYSPWKRQCNTRKRMFLSTCTFACTHRNTHGNTFGRWGRKHYSLTALHCTRLTVLIPLQPHQLPHLTGEGVLLRRGGLPCTITCLQLKMKESKDMSCDHKACHMTTKVRMSYQYACVRVCGHKMRSFEYQSMPNSKHM